MFLLIAIQTLEQSFRTFDTKNRGKGMVVCSMVPITLNPHITSFTMHNSPIQALHEGIVWLYISTEDISYKNDRDIFSILFTALLLADFTEELSSSLVSKIPTKKSAKQKHSRLFMNSNLQNGEMRVENQTKTQV
jgi:hypothetical protein